MSWRVRSWWKNHLHFHYTVRGWKKFAPFFSIISGLLFRRIRNQTKLFCFFCYTLAKIDLEFRMFSCSPWTLGEHPFLPRALEYQDQHFEASHTGSLWSGPTTLLSWFIFFSFETLVTELGVPHMLDKCSVTELNPQSFSYWLDCVAKKPTSDNNSSCLFCFPSRTTMMKFAKNSSGSCLT